MSLCHIRDIFLDILFPAQCVVCGRSLTTGEKYLCLHCIAEFPRVNLRSYTENELHRRLMNKGIEIERAASYMIYRRESRYANLIRTAKYGHRQLLCRDLGFELAKALHQHGFFDGIDLIVPVPMSPIKKLCRGYNQSVEIAKGISDVTGTPIATDCLKARYHATQTRKNTSERLENAGNTYFMPHPEDWQGVGHILLVDDVITSGATMLACAHHLHEGIPELKVSVASYALTARQ